MPVTSIRLAENDLKYLDEMAKRKSIDRTNLIKRAIELGVRDMLVEEALERYRKGQCSAWECARSANITLWEFIDLLKKHDMFFRTDEVELERALEEFSR